MKLFILAILTMIAVSCVGSATIPQPVNADHTCPFVGTCAIGWHWDSNSCRCAKD